jgi:histone H3/H4
MARTKQTTRPQAANKSTSSRMQASTNSAKRMSPSKSNRKHKRKYNLESYINKIANTEQDIHLSSEAKNILNNIAVNVIERTAEAANLFNIYQKRQTCTSREVQSAIRLALDQSTMTHELAKHAISEGTKAITNYNMNDDIGNATAKAGLILSVPRVRRIFNKYLLYSRVGAGAAPYLAGVVQYLLMEIIQISANIARDQKKSRIKAKHIVKAIQHDGELSRVFKNAIFNPGRPEVAHEVLKGRGKKIHFTVQTAASSDVTFIKRGSIKKLFYKAGIKRKSDDLTTESLEFIKAKVHKYVNMSVIVAEHARRQTAVVDDLVAALKICDVDLLNTFDSSKQSKKGTSYEKVKPKAASEGTKKRFRAGTLASKKIKHYSGKNSDALYIPRQSFYKYIKLVAHEYKDNLRLRSSFVDSLRVVIETMLTKNLEKANILALRNGRVTVKASDLSLVNLIHY